MGEAQKSGFPQPLTIMKKSTVKPAKSTASTKKTSAKIVKKPAATAAKPAAASKTVSTPAKSTSTAKAPAVKAAAPVVQTPTTITARIDVGFGNALYLRGEGPGLSWDVGVALDCVASDRWTIALPHGEKPIIFKLLINDLTWSQGSDYVVAPGSNVTVTPSF